MLGLHRRPAVGWPLRIVCHRSIMVGATKTPTQGICLGRVLKYFYQIRLENSDRFLPYVEKLNQRSVIPVLRLMECFEIWVKLTSQPSVMSVFLCFDIFRQLFEFLNELVVEKCNV